MRNDKNIWSCKDLKIQKCGKSISGFVRKIPPFPLPPSYDGDTDTMPSEGMSKDSMLYYYVICNRSEAICILLLGSSVFDFDLTVFETLD